MRRKAGIVFLLTLAMASNAATAQSSSSYESSEHVLNSGGAPEGTALASTSYTLSLVSIGAAVSDGNGLASASFRLSGGFPPAYPAPGEVLGLSFRNATALSWDAEPSAGSYNLYRGLLSSLAGLGYGGCAQPGLTSPTATDIDSPPPGDGFFYLVTVENRLNEEGTKGADGDNSQRTGSVCP